MNDLTLANEMERIAGKNLQTPVSFIGSFKMIWPLARGGQGWGHVGRVAGTVVLLALYWLVVTLMFYMVMIGFLILAPIWLIYTMHRRHQIQAARRTLIAAGGQRPAAL